MEIYYSSNGQRCGPITLDQAKAKVAAGEFQLSELAWVEGWQNWQPLASVPGMGEQPVPPPLPSTLPGTSVRRFARYADVPVYQRQWFFWIMYFTITPIALGILLFGDVYYVKRGEVVGFGIANRIVAGLIGVFALMRVVSSFSQ